MSELSELFVRLRSCRRLVNVCPEPLRLLALAPEDTPAGDDACTSLEHALGLACDAFDMKRLALVRSPVLRPSAAERIVARRLQWDPRSTPVRFDDFASPDLVRGAIAAALDCDAMQRFEVGTVQSRRGASLRTYACGSRHAPAWVLVLPYGVPVEICAELALEVGREFRFITFEGPDLIGDPAEFDELEHGVEAVATDVLSVLEHFEVAKAHVVGICSGAFPTLCFAARHGERVSSMALVNGSYATKGNLGDELVASEFIALAERIGGQRDRARIFYKFMSMQDLSDKESPHLTMVPYSNPDLLYMFLTAFKSYYDERLDASYSAWIEAIRCPTLVMLGERDTITSPARSREIAARITGSQLLVDNTGTHLSLMCSPKRAMLDAMLAFCRTHAP
jgi:pimeloyl-ACP methyl ester carboxylesterase